MTPLGRDTAVLTVAGGLARLAPAVRHWACDIAHATHVRLHGSLPAELLAGPWSLDAPHGSHAVTFHCPAGLESKRPVGCEAEFLQGE